MKPRLIYDYTGFYGQISDNTAKNALTTVCWKLGNPETPFQGKNGAIQWVSPLQREEVDPFPQTSEGQLFLSGLVYNETGSLCSFAQNIWHILKNQQFEQLATTVDMSAGCYVESAGMVYLWVGFAASNESVFYRIDGSQLRWSTNPLDLIYTDAEIDPWALRRCCHGDDIFVYRGLQRVEQGHLVSISPHRHITDYQFDRFLPDEQLLSRKMSLERFAQATRIALQDAIQPLASTSDPVGIMLSGGAGSAALLATMKEKGVNVIAYHMEPTDPAGSEYHFANLTCQALNVPLRRIEMDTGPDYLSPSWSFSHPFGHSWARWYMQLGEQARQDGVRVVISGGGDDSSFGPELEYSVHAILWANISWKEKVAMIKGMLSTDWNIFDILRSSWPGHQLIGPSSVAGPKKKDREMRTADFLIPLPPHTRELDDAAVIHAPRFAAQSLAIGQTLQHDGIHLYYPYHHRKVQAVSLALPPAYRLIPHMRSLFSDLTEVPDQIINKPVLRFAFRTSLPEEVIWRTWSVYTQAPVQMFCLNHPERLRQLLGAGSLLAQRGISDPSRVACVLADRELIRENYQTLVASGMVEIFLQTAQRQWERGAPIWA